MIDSNIRLCRFVEDVVHTDTNKADLINVDIITDTVIKVNTIIHVWRSTIHWINVLDELRLDGVLLFSGSKWIIGWKTCSSKFTL